MAEVIASAEREVAAPAGVVIELLSDYREARPRILTANYSDYHVEDADGALRVVYRFAAGRRERDYRLRVEQTQPGRSLREEDEGSSFVTTWTVDPAGGGSRVRIESRWQGAGGIGGFFERRFAPAALGRVYDELLANLDRELSGRAAA